MATGNEKLEEFDELSNKIKLTFLFKSAPLGLLSAGSGQNCACSANAIVDQSIN